MVLGECGRLPLQIVYMSKAVKYWCRLLHLSHKRLPKQCYFMLKSLDDVGRATWATHIKNILFQYGFGYAWIGQDVGDIENFMSLFKQRLSDTLTQSWYSSVINSPKCKYYCQYKTLLNVERYLCCDIPIHLKSAFSKFRCSNFNLAVETGRYENVNYSERFCLYCMSRGISVTEDEWHVFYVCECYVDIRNEYIAKYLTKYHSINNFVSICQSSNVDVIKNVYLYLYYVHKRIKTRG